jgi:hypothetical protein
MVHADHLLRHTHADLLLCHTHVGSVLRHNAMAAYLPMGLAGRHASLLPGGDYHLDGHTVVRVCPAFDVQAHAVAAAAELGPVVDGRGACFPADVSAARGLAHAGGRCRGTVAAAGGSRGVRPGYSEMHG